VCSSASHYPHLESSLDARGGGPADGEAGSESETAEDGDGDGDAGDGDGDGDPGDGDGVCDPAAFEGIGIANDPWGLGDFCDEIYVCVSNVDLDALIDLLGLPEENCMSDLACGDGQRCTLSYGAVVDQQTVDNACAALTLVDTVWCVLIGP
jgi:hypothetical protein